MFIAHVFIHIKPEFVEPFKIASLGQRNQQPPRAGRGPL